MKEFFHGWRRKAGVVSLGLACAVCGMWGRSLAEVDSFQASRSDRLISADGSLIWAAQTSGIRFPLFSLVWYRDVMARDRDSPTMCEISFDWDCKSRTGFAGIERGYHMAQDVGIRWFRLSYSSLVLVITILSAVLLLCPQRKRPCPN